MKHKIRYGKSVIVYSIVKSKRRKTSQIIVDNRNVIIRTPTSKTYNDITNLIKEKAQWIYKKQLEQKNRGMYISKELYKTKLLYFGNEVPLTVKEKQKTNSISYSKKKFSINLKEKYSKTQVKRIYDQWLFKQATKYLDSKTWKLASKIGTKPSKIIIKRLKGRWGSATKDNVVNFNLHLLKAPKDVIDYIIIHELCHLRIKDHSKEYWSLVRKFVFHFEKQKQWLEKNQEILH